MKAVVKYARGIGNVDYREVPEPFPASNEVKIEVKRLAYVVLIFISTMKIFNSSQDHLLSWVMNSAAW